MLKTSNFLTAIFRFLPVRHVVIKNGGFTVLTCNDEWEYLCIHGCTKCLIVLSVWYCGLVYAICCGFSWKHVYYTWCYYHIKYSLYTSIYVLFCEACMTFLGIEQNLHSFKNVIVAAIYVNLNWSWSNSFFIVRKIEFDSRWFDLVFLQC